MKKQRNSRFANYVTNMAFNLSLSKGMIVCMAQIAGAAKRFNSTPYWAVGAPDDAVPSIRRLTERGLVFAADPEKPGLVEFTEAGKHVFELLKIAGLIVQLKDAINDYEEDKKKA